MVLSMPVITFMSLFMSNFLWQMEQISIFSLSSETDPLHPLLFRVLDFS